MKYSLLIWYKELPQEETILVSKENFWQVLQMITQGDDHYSLTFNA